MNEDLERFVDDLGASVELADATNRQREIGKAWLRFAISHARSQAAKRRAAALRAQPASPNSQEA